MNPRPFVRDFDAAVHSCCFRIELCQFVTELFFGGITCSSRSSDIFFKTQIWLPYCVYIVNHMNLVLVDLSCHNSAHRSHKKWQQPTALTSLSMSKTRASWLRADLYKKVHFRSLRLFVSCLVNEPLNTGLHIFLMVSHHKYFTVKNKSARV